MSSEDNGHVTDLLPDYILDILTDEEIALVADHLSSCQVCQAEYSRLQFAAAELPLALTQSDPPPVIKNRIMNEIRASRSQTQAASKLSFWNQLGILLRKRAPALALALIVVLFIGNWLLWDRVSQVSNQPTPAMIVVALNNTEASPEAVGTLVMDQAGHYGTLVVDKLEELDPDQQYQVWLNHDGERTSAGIFSVNYAGYAALELDAPEPLIDYDAVGITIEPFGGSPGPTGAKVLGVDIPH